MTPEPPEDADAVLARRQRSKRLYYGLIAVAVVGYVVLVTIWRFVGGDALILASLAVYWGGGLAALIVYYRRPNEVEDERDREIARRAAGLTLSVIAVVLVLGGPGGVTLERAGVVTVPDWFGPVMWAYVLLFAVYAIAHAYAKREY